jgi:hypothetical protein
LAAQLTIAALSAALTAVSMLSTFDMDKTYSLPDLVCIDKMLIEKSQRFLSYLQIEGEM